MGFLDAVLKMFVGDKSEKDVKSIQPIVEQIKALESEFEKLSLDELRNTSLVGAAHPQFAYLLNSKKNRKYNQIIKRIKEEPKVQEDWQDNEVLPLS